MITSRRFLIPINSENFVHLNLLKVTLIVIIFVFRRLLSLNQFAFYTSQLLETRETSSKI